MNIDPKFIDVDFSKDPNYVQGYFGKQPDLKLMMDNYGDVANVYDEATLKEAAKRIKEAGGGCSRLVKYVLNQKQEGSCVGNGTTAALQIIWAKQYGLDKVIPMSAMSLYKRIGRSAQSGAVVSDAWKEIKERGVLPLDTDENKARFKHTHPATGFSVPLPQGWEETAKMFKGLEATICTHVNEVLSALADRCPVVVGRRGHCVCYCDLLYDDNFVVPYVNSWGKWGSPLGHMEYGFGFDTLQVIKEASDWAFALRSATTPDFITNA